LLTERQIALHGVGYCPEGETTLPDGRKTYLSNRLFVQVFDENNSPIYWVARALFKDMKPKVFNPVGGANTINKADVIFNLNNAIKTGVIVLSEGVFDAITVGDSGTALLGKTMSVYQLLLLIKSGVDTIYLLLDPDAIESELKLADLLSKHIKNVYLCSTVGGDPNEVGRKGCLQALKSAERYSKLTALKYKLR
jgi:DNA primase